MCVCISYIYTHIIYRYPKVYYMYLQLETRQALKFVWKIKKQKEPGKFRKR